MFEKKTDEMLSTESNWDIIIHHQEQWHPTGGGVTARANTAINVSSPVIYYNGDDEYTDHHIKDKIETVDPAAKVCHISNIVVRYFNNHSLLLKPV